MSAPPAGVSAGTWRESNTRDGGFTIAVSSDAAA